jgi:hypothetical protein
MIVHLSPAQRIMRVLPTVILAALAIVAVVAFRRAGWLVAPLLLVVAAVAGAEVADPYLGAAPARLAALLRWYGHSLVTCTILLLFTGLAFLFHWPTLWDRLILLAGLLGAAAFVIGYLWSGRREAGMVVYDNGLPADFNELYHEMEQLVVANGLGNLLDEYERRQASVALNMLFRTVHHALHGDPAQREHAR